MVLKRFSEVTDMELLQKRYNISLTYIILKKENKDFQKDCYLTNPYSR